MTNTTTNKSVSARKAAAYWYAVGRSDEAKGPDFSDEFAAFAEAQAIAYHVDGSTTFLGSVHTQWTEFKEILDSAAGPMASS